ncbi:MAG TPA: hypothetical protein VFV34_11070 [Blastocatellia bacterium]|nr:hypothetical protein [Blastocatellia bacterium]
MATVARSQYQTSPSEDEVRQALQRILRSRQFANAPMKRRFLQLICDAYLEGRGAELNEYLIGCEVFGRDASYNPALDPIVRVGAHETRKKLELYYESGGKDDEIRLEIPVGSYLPAFSRRPGLRMGQPVVGGRPSSIELGSRASIWIAFLSLGFIVLAVVVAMLASSNRRLREREEQRVSAREPPAVYLPVWEPFLKDENPALVVLSNPPVYRFKNHADQKAPRDREVTLSRDETAALERALGRDRFVVKNNAASGLLLSTDEYTGLGEAIGLYLLTDMFKTLDKGVLLKQSRTASPEDLKGHNVVLLGSVWVNEWSGKVPMREDFVNSARATIVNQNPRSGEMREYAARFDKESGNLIEDHALITVRPNISDNKTVVVLAGTHSEGTEAAAEYATREDYLKHLNQRLQSSAGNYPRYFQALLKVAVDNGIPTTISIVAAHELQPASR